eukprot:TRINITY_DN1857_c0_g1_i5.p1 TRINITY_DN1857_c0_g1~~TRINITY_DN1857_c0_g1_i5.p1  ORF type:complete len:181 (+),score=18.02 TRINITY_DN1857_c0_g1_i5:552-1094(+)
MSLGFQSQKFWQSLIVHYYYQIQKNIFLGLLIRMEQLILSTHSQEILHILLIQHIKVIVKLFGMKKDYYFIAMIVLSTFLFKQLISISLIQFYEGSKMIMQFNLTIPNQAIKGISPIPELESLAFVVDHIVYLLNYSSINQKNESEIKLLANCCLLYTSDAADEEDSVDLGGRRIIKKKK